MRNCCIRRGCVLVFAAIAVTASSVAWASDGGADAGSTAAAPARDAGSVADSAPAKQAPQTTTAATSAPASAPSDANWHAARTAKLTAQIAALGDKIQRLQALKPTDLKPDPQLLPKGLAIDDPQAIDKQLVELRKRHRELGRELSEREARAVLLRPVLKRDERALERYEKRSKQRPRLKIPQAVAKAGRLARQRRTLLALETESIAAQRALLDAQRAYLSASQAARRQAQAQADALARKAAEELKKAQREQQRVLAESKAAEHARQQALDAQRRARSEAERLIAGERARLEGIRLDQTKVKQTIAKERAAIVELRQRLERFRVRVAARADNLKPAGRSAWSEYDDLYDQVVAELKHLRPAALNALTKEIKGYDEVPGDELELGGAVRKLHSAYPKDVDALTALAKQLAAQATTLAAQRKALGLTRLALLSDEVSALNGHRTALMERISPTKHNELTTFFARATYDQLSREANQLVVDGLYWTYRRLRQVDEVPRMILDIFTVGTVLWTLVKVVLLFILLRFILRRWDGWLAAATRRTNRSIALGLSTLFVAKLIDAIRHSGPTLIVLITGMIFFRMLGSQQTAASEIIVVYTVFFWVAIYRLQLRLVESVAKYTGIEQALRAAEGEELLEAEEDLEGPPVPQSVRLAHQAAQTGAIDASKESKVVPASVLLVRSVRTTTRYILAVVLVLELAELAVGKGTIYGLTAKFSWWAALPFILFYLKLWRPHIVSAYQALSTGSGQQSRLERLVDGSKRRWYGVFVVGAAFVVVFGNRLASFARRYLSSLEATKRLLAFIFRRQVERRAQQLGRVITQRQKLPQRLLDQFPTGPLEARQRPHQPPLLDEIKEIVDNWKQNHSDGSIALVGRAGMGRTTLINMLGEAVNLPLINCRLDRKITDVKRLVTWLGERFGFESAPKSEQELIRAIRADPRPMVAVDDCHNLFLRQVDGFEAWEAFVRIVNETCDNIFWVLSFNQSAWEYLRNVGGRIDYFRRVLTLKAWSEDAIRTLIMQRTRRAGIRVSFSDLVMTQLSGVDNSQQIGRTSQSYFRLLWNFTGGNPRLAGHFWLDSLMPEESQRAAKVHLFAEPDIGQLEALPDNLAFVLTAVAQHENLGESQAAQATNLTRNFCRFAFRYCEEEGYLIRSSNEAVRLSLRWQRTIMRYLKRKHLLRGES